MKSDTSLFETKHALNCLKPSKETVSLMQFT